MRQRIKAKVLTRLREKDGLSIRALAGKAEISASYLSKIERGLADGTPVVALKLARALDVPAEAIWTADDASDFQRWVAEITETTAVADAV